MPSYYYNIHYHLARHIVIRPQGYQNMKTRKENKLVTRMSWYCDQVIALQGYQNISPCVLLIIVKQREFYGNKRFTLNIRVCVGINMDVQIPLLIIDRKEFWVMSTHYRTCGVTRLMIIIFDFLSTTIVCNMRELHRINFREIEKNSTNKNRKKF
jgi:hypothetical protein